MDLDSDLPIIKKVIHAGYKHISIQKGFKTHFHFQTWKLGNERELLDDSKKIGKKEPMVLIIGHKFKLEVWEQAVKMMALGEVASFKVKKELVFSYPFVSKTIRDLGKDPSRIKHSCTMTLQTEGIGYKDLDELIKNPCDLEFIIELLKVETTEEYEKDLWQLDDKERLNLIPSLREKGNMLYSQKLYDEAEEAYSKAIGICEQFMLREKKDDEDWITYNKLKLPILLNYAQCKLMKGEYYSVIEHCNTVLEYDKDNEKALFRRAKAHVGAWNPIEAEKDFKRLLEINPSMGAIVERELLKLKTMCKEKEKQYKDAMKKLFTNT